jgi:hypothetical protein
VRAMEATALPERAKEIFIDWKERHHDPPWSPKVFPSFYPAFFARLLLGGLLAVALIVIGWRVRDLEAATFASLAALLLVSPTLHPWYLLWVLPLAAKLREPAFLYFSFVAPLAYALLYPVSGVSRGLVLGLEYAPFTVLLLVSTVSLARRRASSPASP